MFIANYGLKSLVQKAAMVARLPIAYSAEHPYTGLKHRAHEATLDYISSAMPDALAFDTPRELMAHAISLAAVDGLWAEFGVNEGGTIRFIARKRGDVVVHGFDSFEGLPEDWSGNAMAAGIFNRNGRLPKVPDNVRLHRGWFNESLPAFVQKHQGPAAFLHIDCDLYSSTAEIFKAFGDRIVAGSVIVFDEYFNYPNWQSHEHKALMEFQAASGKRFRSFGYSVQQVGVIAL